MNGHGRIPIQIATRVASSRLKRSPRLTVLSVTTSLGTLLLVSIGFAYNPNHTHPKLNELGAQVVLKPDVDPNELYSEIGDYIGNLKEGAQYEDEVSLSGDECNEARCTRHFYHPFTGQGHRYDPIEVVNGDFQCNNAVQWARDDMLEKKACRTGDDKGKICNTNGECSNNDCTSEGDHLTWMGAIEFYQYTPGPKRAAYKRLGHVAHLVGDMAQPDHVHLEPHRHIAFGGFLGDNPDDDHIEGWTVDHWDEVGPNISDIVPRRYSDMESHLTELAKITWATSSYEGTLDESDLGARASGEITEMFDVDYSTTWTLENKPIMDPGTQYDLGNWQGGRNGDNACDVRPEIENDESDDWWETQTETEWQSLEGQDLCGFYAFEEMDEAIPYTFKVYRWHEDTRSWSRHDHRQQGPGGDNTFYTLSRIYTGNLLREAVANIAGLYMHFLDVVTHPPVVMSAEIRQGADCKYGKSWQLQDGNRSLSTDCVNPSDGGWINGLGKPATIQLNFAADYEDNLTPIPRKMSTEPGQIIVRLQRDGQVVEVLGALLVGDQATWVGGLAVPSDGSLNGRWTITISAKDSGPHLPAELRPVTGHDLDSDPSTLAFAREPSANVYTWLGYEPGVDLNHEIYLDATAPSMSFVAGEIDPLGKMVAKFAVSDADSGIQSINVSESGNASVVVSGSEITITRENGALSGHALLGLSDVAGNSSQQRVVIPAIETCTRAADAEGKIATRVFAFGDSGFDPRSVKIGAWLFGSAKARSGSYNDANGDGIEDVVLYYSMNEAGGGTECLTGRPSNDTFVASCQALKICDGDHDGVADFDDLCPFLTAFTLTGCGSGLAAGGGGSRCPDADSDDICDDRDNCLDLGNADQLDSDGDGVGNACDTTPGVASVDSDGDGVADDADNCPDVANANQADIDGDGVGDSCDETSGTVSFDADGDGISDDVDNCPSIANTDQADADGDNVGDACIVTPEPEPGQNLDDPGTGAFRICGRGACGPLGGANLTLMILGLCLLSTRPRR